MLVIVTGISVLTSRIYQSIRKELDDLVGQVREAVTGWRVIRAFGQREREIKTFHGSIKDIRNNSYRLVFGPVSYRL